MLGLHPCHSPPWAVTEGPRVSHAAPHVKATRCGQDALPSSFLPGLCVLPGRGVCSGHATGVARLDSADKKKRNSCA